MKKHTIVIWAFAALLFITSAGFDFAGRQSEPWRTTQLVEPGELAAAITNPVAIKPLIISIGPGAMIKGSIDIGPADEKENLEKLKALLSKENKNRDIVIYCGCCPFKNCPNIRPAFSLLNEMKFTNAKLLNLSHNIKVDWIDHHYPTNSTK